MYTFMVDKMKADQAIPFNTGTFIAAWLMVFMLCTFRIAAAAQINLTLVEVSKQQDWDSVLSLLKDGKLDINAAEADGATALAWAAYWDQDEIVKLLLGAGADPDAANDYGVTPLILACENRSIAVVDTLLGTGKADPDKALWNGQTPLMIAARTGFIEAVHSLLDHGAKVKVQESRRGQSALMWAIFSGHQDVARLLIESGDDVNARTTRLNEKFRTMDVQAYGSSVAGTFEGGYSPLMFSALKGDLATSRLLVEQGADINLVSAADGSALVIASAKGHEELALFLVERGADPNVADANGMTPLHYAMNNGLKVLHGDSIIGDARVCGFGGENHLCKPLEVLSEDEHALLKDPTYYLFVVEPKSKPGQNMHDLAEALLSRGANPDAAMKFPPPHLRFEHSWFSLMGATPFFLAAASQDKIAVEMMLEAGANPLVSTAVYEDAFYNETLKHADDNQVIGNATLLMAAAGISRRHAFSIREEDAAVQIVERLISLGADVNATNATGWTALHAASFIGARRLVSLLINKGAKIDVTNGCGQTPMSLALGNNQEGIPDRAVPQAETAELLLQLGAGNNPPLAPVGKCVLGRGGLEADASQNTLVKNRVQDVIQKLEQKKQKWM